VAERLERLRSVLPSSSLRAAEAARLAVRVDGVAERLLELRAALPGADLVRLASGNPRLLTSGDADFAAGLARTLGLLAGARDPGGLLAAAPALSDADALEAVLDELGRLFGGRAAALAALEGDPSLATAAQPLRGQSRGERDAGYLRELLSGRPDGDGG